MSTEQSSARTGKHVVVIGGGVIGLSAGYYLSEDGFRVTVLERNAIGKGASWGNAGWIVPSLVHPFNAPGAAPQAFKAMLDRSSPIAMRQVPTLGLALWGMQFLRHSSAARSKSSLQQLSSLATTATEDMATLADELGFELHHDGLLVAFRTEEAIEKYLASHRHIEELGYSGRIERLNAEEAHAREPSLSSAVTGALHFLDEQSVRPASVTAAFAAAIDKAGGEVAENEALRSLDRAGSRWTVRTSARTLHADAVVVAAGEHTARIVRPFGARLPLQSGRGCSVVLRPDQLTLRQPLKIAETRVACTPFANGETRVSGTFDLTRLDAKTAVGRMRSVLRSGSAYLPALADVEIEAKDVWSGARPSTPDSVPIVARVERARNLFVATGHGTLGVTLAPETGRRVRDLVRLSLPA